jgi:hypothetical protein
MTPQKSQSRSFFNLRAATPLSQELDKQILAYVAAASAAGVGMLALAKPAEGKVVYTPTHKIVQINEAVPIDLNHDGIHDFDVFNLTHNSTTPFGDYLAAEPLQSGNQVWVVRTNRGFANYAAALKPDVHVGPSAKHFAAGRDNMAFWSLTAQGTVSGGPWKNVKSRFLGLKFFIKGKTHYGWARLNVSIVNENVSATLTGYAYETVANKPIVTGKTKGEAGLGMLARGK